MIDLMLPALKPITVYYACGCPAIRFVSPYEVEREDGRTVRPPCPVHQAAYRRQFPRLFTEESRRDARRHPREQEEDNV